jgi:hypothetical protein
MKLLRLALITLFVSGCSDDAEPDVEISLRQRLSMFGPLLVVNVQALNDEVVVKNLVVNRGSCKLMEVSIKDLKRKPKLKFAESFQGDVSTCTAADIKEIQVETGKGTFDFTFG